MKVLSVEEAGQVIEACGIVEELKRRNPRAAMFPGFDAAVVGVALRRGVPVAVYSMEELSRDFRESLPECLKPNADDCLGVLLRQDFGDVTPVVYVA